METKCKGVKRGLDKTMFAIKMNNCAVHEPCAVCGEDIHPGVGPQLFEKDSWDSVCLDCGRKYAPELVEALIKYWNMSEYDTWNPKKQGESDAAADRRNTCLDEPKTAELWAISRPRYYAHLVSEERTFYLFHDGMPDDEICQLVVFGEGRTIDDLTYPRSAIEQTFTRAEVMAMRQYFKADYPDFRLKLTRAGPPDNNCMGYGDYAVGGRDDFWMFPKSESYNLPFKVWGYFERWQ